MNKVYEGYRLRMDEFLTLLSLAGVKRYIGFQSEECDRLTWESMMEACCRLLRDQAMTQIDGRYQFHKDLYDVMLPVRDARTVLSMHSAREDIPQVMYYVAEQITAMEPTAYGSYSLHAFPRSGLESDLMTRLGLRCQHKDAQPASGGPEAAIRLSMTQDQFPGVSLFVMECLSAETGLRTGWLRALTDDGLVWLEWADESGSERLLLTEGAMQTALERLLKAAEDKEKGDCCDFS